MGTRLPPVLELCTYPCPTPVTEDWEVAVMADLFPSFVPLRDSIWLFGWVWGYVWKNETDPGEPTVRGPNWGERFCVELKHIVLLALLSLLPLSGKVKSFIFLSLPSLASSFPGPECAVLGDFFISTSIIQQVKAVEWVTHLHAIHWKSFETVNQPGATTDPRLTILRAGVYISSRSWSYAYHMWPTFPIYQRRDALVIPTNVWGRTLPGGGSPIAVFFQDSAFVKINLHSIQSQSIITIFKTRSVSCESDLTYWSTLETSTILGEKGGYLYLLLCSSQKDYEPCLMEAVFLPPSIAFQG